jgi:predicted alpha-1,6-mannanase (GH76 family)
MMTWTARATLLFVALLLVTAGAGVTGCGTPASPAAVGATHAVSMTPPGTPAPARASTPAQKRAALALAAFDRAFYVAFGARAHHANTTAAGRAVFWRQAELIEMEEDAYQASGDPAARQKIVALFGGVSRLYGRNWTRRTWNDDIMWMVIAAIRAYELTGDPAYRTMAKRNFDIVYARAWSRDLGGGLWWITGSTSRVQKNVTTNATAAIAACKLAAALHDPSYLAKAQRLYRWLRATLYDPRTGAVWDSVSPAASGSGVVTNRAAITYNQGTFIGASDLLDRALHDAAYRTAARKALDYTKNVMAAGGVLPAETGTNGNLGGFKGIFCRWALKFVHHAGIRAYDPWFRLNADTAWRHRDARRLMGADWSVPTAAGVLDSWGCSSAVVLLEGLAAR